MPTQKIAIMIYLDPWLADAISKFAETRCESRSATIRFCIREVLASRFEETDDGK